ncbi:MAG: lipid-binding SYLF domain-containing protein [Terriglobia bacterium]
MRKWLIFLALILGFCGVPRVQAQTKEVDRLGKATLIINAIMQAPDNAIPSDFLNRAVCVGVIPSEKKLAFGLGANYGRGVMVCRRAGNGPWGAPSMMMVGGGSYGFQLGGEASDIVFIVMSNSAAEKIMDRSLKLGVDVSAAAGPVGRRAEGATNAHFSAEILSYSRSRGLFAGVSLSGAVLEVDKKANRKLYGREIAPQKILISGTVSPPVAAKPLDQILEKYSPKGGAPLPKPAVTSSHPRGSS